MSCEKCNCKSCKELRDDRILTTQAKRNLLAFQKWLKIDPPRPNWITFKR